LMHDLRRGAAWVTVRHWQGYDASLSLGRGMIPCIARPLAYGPRKGMLGAVRTTTTRRAILPRCSRAQLCTRKARLAPQLDLEWPWCAQHVFISGLGLGEERLPLEMFDFLLVTNNMLLVSAARTCACPSSNRCRLRAASLGLLLPPPAARGQRGRVGPRVHENCVDTETETLGLRNSTSGLPNSKSGQGSSTSCTNQLHEPADSGTQFR
jgi:hypothetical protein